VQEKVRKVPTTQGIPISVIAQVPITGDIRENPIASATAGTTFMSANEDNIRRLCQQNQEKEEIIMELEERIQQVKVDENNMQSFKASAEKVRKEMEEAIIDMYAHLHLFQQEVATIIEKNSQIKVKLAQFNMIREGINDIDKWIVENLDAPPKIYRPSTLERKTNLYSLECFQQDEKRAYKEVTKLMVVCSKLHKVAHELIKGIRLPQLDELGKNLFMEELVDKVHNNTNHRRSIVRDSTTITIDLIEKHLL